MNKLTPHIEGYEVILERVENNRGKIEVLVYLNNMYIAGYEGIKRLEENEDDNKVWLYGEGYLYDNMFSLNNVEIHKIENGTHKTYVTINIIQDI